MRKLSLLLILVFAVTALIGQNKSQPAVILISSQSTPDFIAEMKDHLEHSGIILNVEKEIWANREELQEFAFTITNTKTRDHKSFHFKYNELNKHQIFLVFPVGEDRYNEVITDVTYLRTELLSFLIPIETRKLKPVIHRSYAKSGSKYRESTLLKELESLEEELKKTVNLYRAIKADQTVGKNISGLTYTYNGAIVEDPAVLNLRDMSADVLIETLSDDSMIVNIWSDEPLKEYGYSTTMVGQE